MATNVIFRGSVENVKPTVAEAKAAAALTPGWLLFKSSGDFAAFNTDGGGDGVKLYVCDMNTLKQQTATEAWTSGDTAIAFEPKPGERYNMVVSAAQNITAVDTPLAADGAGTLRIGVPGTDFIVCYADEVINTSGTAQLVAVKF